jgi:hypothetical protein
MDCEPGHKGYNDAIPAQKEVLVLILKLPCAKWLEYHEE